MPDDVGRDALAEVGLEAVDALVEQARAACRRYQCARGRVGEVDQRHAGLPLVPLPDVAVGPLHAGSRCAVPSSNSGERCAMYGLIHTQIRRPARLAAARSMPSRVGEGVAGPTRSRTSGTRASRSSRSGRRDSGRSRSAMPSMKRRDGRLVVVGGERRRQPQPERPGGRQRGPAGQRGVLAQDRPWASGRR